MELSIFINGKGASSYQLQISEQILELIKNGSISADERLPSSRTLSEQLGVSRNTVKGAYDKLIEQGYIESIIGSGTYVSKTLPDDAIKVKDPVDKDKIIKNTLPVELTSKTEGREENLYRRDTNNALYDFQLERTDPDSFPTKIWRRLINYRLTSARRNMTQYGEPTGLLELRKAIATRLGSTRGMRVNPEQVIILTGIQQGLNIVSHLLIRKGSKVVLESPGYKGASYLFENYGAKIVPVPVDEQGIIIDKLPNKQIDVAMITPSRHFPLCATLPIERRKKIIEWAVNTTSYILEVDYDSDFRYEGSPLRAIRSFDAEQRVIYLSSFAKSIGPGLRMGYMVVPPSLIEHAKSSKILLDYGLPWLDQVVLTDFITSGGFENHIKRLRQLYLTRRDCLLNSMKEAFGEISVKGIECGTHIVWDLPESLPDAGNLQKNVRKKQVGIYTLRHHTIYNWENMKNNHRVILLGYAGISEDNICKGISHIAAAVE